MELFFVFAVSKEDHLHSAPVIELLWRSCQAYDGKREDELSLRLRVRQMTQLLVDNSLLLGSSMDGVHMHDIPLSFVRNSFTSEELRAMHSNVVQGFIRESESRGMYGLQPTNTSAAACEGEVRVVSC